MSLLVKRLHVQNFESGTKLARVEDSEITSLAEYRHSPITGEDNVRMSTDAHLHEP